MASLLREAAGEGGLSGLGVRLGLGLCFCLSVCRCSDSKIPADWMSGGEGADSRH